MAYDDPDDYEDDRPRRRRSRRVEPESGIGDDPAMRLLLPVGRSPWAIIAGYLGLFSVLCLPAPFALIVGIVAIIDIRNHPEKHGMGRAIFGVVMGAIGCLVMLGAIVASMVSVVR